MAKKRFSELPSLGAATSAGRPAELGLIGSDIIPMTVSGTPGEAFPGGSFTASGYASVKATASDIADYIFSETEFLAVQSIVESTSADIPALSSAIDTLSAAIASNDSDISALSANVTTNISDISTLQSDLATTATTLDNEIQTRSDERFVANARLLALENEVDTLGDLADLDIEALSALDATTLNDRISDLEDYDISADARLFSLENVQDFIVLQTSGTFFDNDYASGYADAVDYAVTYNETASANIAVHTQEYLKIVWNNGATTRYLPLYIMTQDHPSGA